MHGLGNLCSWQCGYIQTTALNLETNFINSNPRNGCRFSSAASRKYGSRSAYI